MIGRSGMSGSYSADLAVEPIFNFFNSFLRAILSNLIVELRSHPEHHLALLSVTRQAFLMPEILLSVLLPFHFWVWARCIHEPCKKLFVINIDFFLNSQISPLVSWYYAVVSDHTRERRHIFLRRESIKIGSIIGYCRLSLTWVSIASRCWNRSFGLASIGILFLHRSWNNLRPLIRCWISFDDCAIMVIHMSLLILNLITLACHLILIWPHVCLCLQEGLWLRDDFRPVIQILVFPLYSNKTHENPKMNKYLH